VGWPRVIRSGLGDPRTAIGGLGAKWPAMPDVHVPTIFFPRRGDTPAEPVPYVLTDEDLIRLLQLDPEKGKQTLDYYRREGLLRATQVSRFNRYKLPEVLQFLDRLDAKNPR
jgi:hypothetical protein